MTAQSKANAKDFLERFQKEFTAAIRQPLAVDSGTLKSPDLSKESESLKIEAGEHGPASARLTVYQQQYWFRLFTVMQGQAPLTARLLGLWTFNQLVQEFLLAQSPSHYDLNELSAGFDRHLKAQTRATYAKLGHKNLDPLLIEEAWTIDQAYIRAFYAPPQKLWRPSPDEASRLPHLKLVASKALVFFRERHSLLALRQGILEGKHPGEGPILPGPKREQPVFWALFRRSETLAAKALDEVQYALYQLLSTHPIAEAMERLERQFPDRAGIEEKVMIWLSQSLDDGFWTGAEGP